VITGATIPGIRTGIDTLIAAGRLTKRAPALAIDTVFVFIADTTTIATVVPIRRHVDARRATACLSGCSVTGWITTARGVRTTSILADQTSPTLRVQGARDTAFAYLVTYPAIALLILIAGKTEAGAGDTCETTVTGSRTLTYTLFTLASHWVAEGNTIPDATILGTLAVDSAASTTPIWQTDLTERVVRAAKLSTAIHVLLALDTLLVDTESIASGTAWLAVGTTMVWIV